MPDLNNTTAGPLPCVAGLQTFRVTASAQVVLPLVHHDGQAADVGLRVGVEGDLIVKDADVSLALVVSLDVAEIAHMPHSVGLSPVIAL